MEIKYTWEHFIRLAKIGIKTESNYLADNFDWENTKLTIVRHDGERDIAEMPDYIIINQLDK